MSTPSVEMMWGRPFNCWGVDSKL